MDPAIATVVWIVAFVLVTITVTGFSGRVGWSAPVILVAVGAVVSYIPAVPRLEPAPELVLYAVLPPLLFAAAIQTSFIDVRARNDSILTLSVILVAFTVVAIGFATWLIVPGLTLAAGFAFGAIVAPTDAVAVTAITGKVNLPRRVVTILEGESLLNDATALVALNTSIAAIVSIVNPWQVAGDFVLAVAGGGAIGLAIGFVVSEVRRRLRAPVLDTSLSLITPYLAFIIAQAIGGSGVLAVVIAGLLLGYRSPTVQSAEARIAERLNWRTIQFLLENAVFLFIGLNLSTVVEGAAHDGPGLWPTVLICLGILVALVVARFAGIFGITLLYRHGPRFLRARKWTWRNATAVASSGIRGVVTLIASFLLPPETPMREFLQFLAFVVVVISLLEGLLLPTIIHKLGLPAPNFDQEHLERSNLMAEAEEAGVRRLEEERTDADELEVIDRLRANAAFLSQALEAPHTDGVEPRVVAYTRLRRVMITAQRQAVLEARREGRYQEAAVLSVLASIDAEEQALKTAAPMKKLGAGPAKAGSAAAAVPPQLNARGTRARGREKRGSSER